MCRRRLVDLAAVLHDPRVLVGVRRLVVSAERHDDLPSVDGDGGSAVANVRAIAHVADDEDDDGAGARSVDHNGVAVLVTALAHLQERLLCLPEASHDSFPWILREAVLLDHEVMELVSQELGAVVPSVAVVDPEEAALGPSFIFAVRWFGDVQNYRDTILVVVANKALIGYSRVSPNDAVALDRALGWLLVGNYNPSAGLQSQLGLTCLFIGRLLVNHLTDIERRQLLDTLMHPC